jgi:hypothetical protein
MPLPTGGFDGVPIGFEPVPGGVYTVEITDATEGTAGEEAKYPGSTYVNWEFTIQDDEEYEGRRLWLNTSFVPSAKPKLKEFLIAVGKSEEELADPDFEVDPEEYIGSRVQVAVTKGINKRTKEENNSVRKCMPLGSMEAEAPV